MYVCIWISFLLQKQGVANVGVVIVANQGSYCQDSGWQTSETRVAKVKGWLLSVTLPTSPSSVSNNKSL